MRHTRLSRRIKAGPVCDHLSINALRPAADGIVKGAPSVKEILFGVFPGSNFFVVHAFTLSLRTAARQRRDCHAARRSPRRRGAPYARGRRPARPAGRSHPKVILGGQRAPQGKAAAHPRRGRARGPRLLYARWSKSIVTPSNTVPERSVYACKILWATNLAMSALLLLPGGQTSRTVEAPPTLPAT